MARRKKASTAQPLLLSVADVAIMLGVCRQTVYNYMANEGLPSVRISGKRSIHREELDRWIKAHQVAIV